MKIIQLVTSRKRRGAEIAAFHLSSFLTGKGHQVWFIGLYEADDNALSLEKETSFDLLGNRNTFLDIKLIFRLRKVIRDISPDLVQANGSDTFKYSTLALWTDREIPIVYRNISTMSHWVNGRKHIRWFYRFLAKRINHFCSVGQGPEEDIQELLGIPAPKSSVIKRGISFIKVQKEIGRHWLERAFAIQKEHFVLVQVGSLSQEKNLSWMLEVMALLVEENPLCKLLVVGEGMLGKSLRIQAEKEGLSGNVIFAGYQENVSHILAGADLMTLTSLVEGIPGVILEAAVQETPAVAVAVGGVAETIIEGKTGVLTNSHNKETFSQAVIRLMKDDALRKQMGEEARNYVLQNHDMLKNGEMFEELYLGLVNGRISID